MYWVYILQSEKRRELYVGYTSNLQGRVAQHQNGRSASTKRYLPWKLIYVEGYSSREDTVIREKNLKYFAKSYIQLKRRLKNSLSFTGEGLTFTLFRGNVCGRLSMERVDSQENIVLE